MRGPDIHSGSRSYTAAPLVPIQYCVSSLPTHQYDPLGHTPSWQEEQVYCRVALAAGNEGNNPNDMLVRSPLPRQKY